MAEEESEFNTPAVQTEGGNTYILPMSQQAPQQNTLSRPETQIEFLKYIVSPQLAEQYLHITKDLAVSNVDLEEIAYVQINLQLLHLIDYIEVNKREYTGAGKAAVMSREGDLDGVRHVILKDIFGYLTLLRSKGGFERLTEATQIVKQHQTLREEKPKAWWQI
jgi:hypothetical protein